METFLECHSHKQKAKVYELNSEKFQKEYILYLEKCYQKKCNGRAIRLGLGFDNKYKHIENIKAKKIQTEIKKGKLINKLPTFKVDPIIDSRWGLNCWVYDHIEVCRQNLSSCNLGKIDNDPCNNLRFFNHI